MKYSALCRYNCIHCGGKLKRRSLSDYRGVVVFYCRECSINNNVSIYYAKSDPEINSKFSVNYLITGEMTVAHIDITSKLVVIEYHKGTSTIHDVTPQDTLMNMVTLKITNYNLTNIEIFKSQLKDYLVFS